MVSWELAKQGWDNLNKIVSDGWDGVKDVFTPSKDDLIRQIRGARGGGGSAVTVLPEAVPEVVPDLIPDSWGKYAKYAKYALIGGAALLAYSIIKK